MIQNATNHILIDHENIHAIDLGPLKGFEARIVIFAGEHQNQFSVSLVAQLASHKYEIVTAAGRGKNALDFHMAYYAGQILAKTPDAFVHFVTKDKGFDPLIKHLKGNSLHAYRVDSISDLAFLRAKNGAHSQSASEEIHAALTEGQRTERTLESLIKMGAARPRKLKTLKSSLQSQFSKILTEEQLTALIRKLQADGKLIIGSDEKITYSLGTVS